MTDTVARSSHRILETERLHLREAVDRDEPGFIRYIDDRKVRTLDDARGHIGKLRDHYWRHGFGLYVVASNDPAAPIGICGLLQRAALDAPDAAIAMLADARSRLAITHHFAITMPGNARSMRLRQRRGLRPLGRAACRERGWQ